MSVRVDVHSATAPWDSPGSFIASLTKDYGRQIVDVLNDTGSWRLSMLRGSAEADLVRQNRVLRFYVDGVLRFAGRIGAWDQQTVAPGEESEEELTLSGGGLLATLKDAKVFPHPTTVALLPHESHDTRTFNFATPEYADTPEFLTWGKAVEQFQQGDAVLSLKGVDVPDNWEDPTAWWIWSELFDLGNDPYTPVGVTYYRTTVSTSEGDFKAFIAADDGYELWVDGVLVASQTEAFAWRTTTVVPLFLGAGEHVIAVKGINILRASSATNTAMFVFALYSTIEGGELDTLELHSDSTWDAIGYPATPPGFTAGEIAGILFGESWDRNGLWLWSYDFSDDDDSEGTAWAERFEIAFQVGAESYLDVVRKLAETYVDLAVDFDVLNLRMVNKGGWNTGSAVALTIGDQLTDLHHSQDPTYATTLLVHQADEKYATVDSTTVIVGAETPRVEAFLEAGSAPSAAPAERMAEGLFDRYAIPKVTVTFGMEPDGTCEPWADWWPGKVISLPDRFTAAADTQVLLLSVTDKDPNEDGVVDGDYVVTAEGLQDLTTGSTPIGGGDEGDSGGGGGGGGGDGSFKQGAYVNGNASDPGYFGGVTGSTPRVAMFYTANPSDGFVDPTILDDFQTWLLSDIRNLLVISVLLLGSDEVQDWDNTTNDAAFTAFAADLTSRGMAARTICRPGWEMNGEYPPGSQFPWQATGPGDRVASRAGYIRCYNRRVALMKAAGPLLRFNWCPNGFDTATVEPWYPGDDNVNIAGVDRYDAFLGVGSDPATRWAAMVAESYQNQVDFAADHDLGLAVDEYGCWHDGDGDDGGGDNPYYIHAHFAWCEDPAHPYLYATYFDSGEGGVGVALEDLPNALDAYHDEAILV